jgi:flagellar hook-length control protein FliK
MSTVQFEPKITSEFQIDWRRRPSQGADPFTDFLKQHFDGERPRAPKPRDEAADPLSGRKPHVVVAHAKTLRGEAKRVEDADRRLPDQSGHPESCAKEAEPVVLEDGVAADEDTAEPETADVQAESDEAAVQPVTDGEAAEPVTPVVVSVQPTAELDADGEAVAVLELPEDGIVPAPEDQVARTPSNDAETGSETTAEQQAAAAMAEASLTEAAAALIPAEAAPTGGATPAAVTQPSALPIVETKVEQPLLQRMAEAAAQAAEPVPAPQAKAERAPLEIKPRAHATARPAPAAPATPAASQAAQPIPQQAAMPLLPTGGSEFASSGETFFESLSDGGGHGWAMNLAQGAASRRPDFVAQLRQHLQNLPAHEQVAIHLQRAVREGTNKFSIQLSPAELGNIHVKLEIDEEKRVTAAVTVERPSTLELLQRDTKGLERALHNAGLNMEGGDLSFSLGRGDQEFAQDLRQSGPSAAGGLDPDGESEDGQPDAPVAQVMDTAAGVVNLQV